MQPLARNALANVARIGTGMAISLVVTAALERRLGKTEFSVWSLGVQLGSMFALLDLGMQTVVSRFVAAATARKHDNEVNEVVSSALAMQAMLAVVGLVPLSLLVALVPWLFGDMPAGLVPEARLSIAAIGTANLLWLATSSISAHLLGTLRAEPLAVISVLGRLAGGAGVVTAAVLDADVGTLGVIWAVALGTSAIAQTLYTRARSPELRVSRSAMSRARAGQLARYGAPLALWTAAGFFVAGLDTTIVGNLDFESVAPYAIAGLAANVLDAAHAAFMGPFLAAFSSMHAAGNVDHLRAFFERVMRWSAVAVLTVSVSVAAAAPWLLRLWVGEDIAGEATTILRVLLAANAIRLFGAPFANLLIATGEQRRVLLSPIAEAVVNLTMSIVLGSWLGAMGVAIGTVLGSCTSLALHFLRNMPRVAWLSLGPGRLAVDAVVVPVVCAAPILLAAAQGYRTSIAALALTTVGWLVALALLWSKALHHEDRQAARDAAARAIGGRRTTG